ncbi:hypothetical protein M9H77_07599 [Catharanthus roseus]|uniref:Uncharacterized protein n=1 Tax=Catharanthus roseus TaxID=4058 RepID=A0ACC0BVP0_CATRO|nr:hypothetical protein M9H77_07599 [Catharanthus roseus]
MRNYMLTLENMMGANVVQAIQDCLISKTSFEEKSFHGLVLFYRKYIKYFGTIASSLMDIPEKKIGFPRQIQLHLNEIASNQVPYSTTPNYSLEMDSGFQLLKSFKLTPFSIEFEGQGKASKLFTICSISKDHSREQFDGENA